MDAQLMFLSLSLLGVVTARDDACKAKSLLQVKQQPCVLPEAEFYSQSDEDKILYRNFFCGKSDGVFVELGALDGKRWSNSKFFEDTMGWKGALIEGSPQVAELLKVNRPSERNLIIPEAVCQEGVGHVEFVISPNNNDVSGNPETMAPDFYERWHSKSSENHFVNVSCRPLADMLEQLANHTGADHVDFFSLDVEGAELEVLKTNDWKVPVHLFMIEMDGANLTKDEAVRHLLYSHNYVKASTMVPRSEIFTLVDDSL
eukprot:TRINITY_DN64926_c0_g1_i1.p1 TRINITY_DN64926_c0_g1~~TRINITY_DN64926_c0_g1_i1.p1  ORF type:complete len:259 (-),score=56.05 TRINITY_DN64926_c0_g1_i1:256-1032(-)